MDRCLYCYQPLAPSEKDFHPACARKIFGTAIVPSLPYTRDDIEDLAREVIRSQTTVPGVQAKLSLELNRGARNEPSRFTIVGLWGGYILKPQSDRFANLPENEDLIMHLAEIAKIKTVPHSLIRFADGELCYLTKRIDRTKDGGKLPMEDMCQLTERLTEQKYKGSYEQIAKAIREYSSAPMLDVMNFWEQVIFSWLTGNADMHLKNFSLYSPEEKLHILTPAYDHLSTVLAMPEDTEELALTLNGKKRKIKREDFVSAMEKSGLSAKTIDKAFAKFVKIMPQWFSFIEQSFLPEEQKQILKDLITARINRITK